MEIFTQIFIAFNKGTLLLQQYHAFELLVVVRLFLEVRT